MAKELDWKLQSSSEATDWDVLWTDNAVQPEVLAKMDQHQKINHFPGKLIGKLRNVQLSKKKPFRKRTYEAEKKNFQNSIISFH